MIYVEFLIDDIISFDRFVSGNALIRDPRFDNTRRAWLDDDSGIEYMINKVRSIFDIVDMTEFNDIKFKTWALSAK